MVAVKHEALERGNSGPLLSAGCIPPKDTTATTTAVVVQRHLQHENSSLSRKNRVLPTAAAAAATQRGENENENRPHLTECGGIVSSVSCSPTGRETLFGRDAEGDTSAAMPGGKDCTSLKDGSGCTQAQTSTLNVLEKSREDIIPGRLARNEFDDISDRRAASSASSSATFNKAASSSLRRDGCEDAASVGSRQQLERRRNPTSMSAGPPLPPSNPPPHLVRRTSRRETAPNTRYVCEMSHPTSTAVRSYDSVFTPEGAPLFAVLACVLASFCCLLALTYCRQTQPTTRKAALFGKSLHVKKSQCPV